MFERFLARANEARDVHAALERSLATIEFALDGTILTANELFLQTMRYSLSEIVGRKHSLFVPPEERDSTGYQEFWVKLRAGEYQRAQFRRIAKDGSEVWVEAAYNPVLDRSGRPFKVVKVAIDVTQRAVEAADTRSQLQAIHRSNALIVFKLDGTILTANDNFLRATGYSLPEIQGRHHSMFLEAGARDGPAYRAFWDRLNRGEFQAGRFPRIGKEGRPIWLEAAYNVILDWKGTPYKVVKYATDITARVEELAGLNVQLEKSFGEIEHAASASRDEAEQAAEAVNRSSTSIQTMAASAEQLAASVREIADAMAKSRSATETADAQRRSADAKTGRLDETSRAMGGIVDVIRNIAGRINLLALNATIESARAGEAGKGFAVVAGEVKNLAQQARNATDQIESEIAKLQLVSSEVVASLSDVGGSIDRLREYVTASASAVEEQSAVTQGISSDMQHTAQSVSAINDNMAAVTEAVSQVNQAVGVTREAAKVLAR